MIRKNTKHTENLHKPLLSELYVTRIHSDPIISYPSSYHLSSPTVPHSSSISCQAVKMRHLAREKAVCAQSKMLPSSKYDAIH